MDDFDVSVIELSGFRDFYWRGILLGNAAFGMLEQGLVLID